ncbi:MAG: phage head-tail connector protein [Rickettsiales bacterium]
MNDDLSTALTLITAPSAEPITLSQAKAFLRIEHTGDDAAITLGITAARQHAEHYLRTALLPQVWEYKIANPCFASVSLPLGPAQSIVSVNATTLNGATTALNAATYRLSVDGRKVIFDPFPNTDILSIRYSASLVANAADVPPLITQGMLHHVAAMMETRDGKAPLPVQSINLYQPYRRISL